MTPPLFKRVSKDAVAHRYIRNRPAQKFLEAQLNKCPQKLPNCPINDILDFHRAIMPSSKALQYAVEKILETPFETIAPQHGSIIKNKKAINHILKLLIALENVGIDGIVDDNYRFEFGNLDDRFKS